ncbi:hypothetical protein JAAARDRAFT_207777 [Jaapia argillacea MUCL 33604]|uniref:MYND-type domain-containing protein n=1 Tax=Jaapia argillacea MUCL 33604 TaxID=933084 RepID=A0A067PS73_9AGAM|nr:hypothetical protein JAAARDRAFT_207777 [Jaapia argillacea MUCL 33604]
MDTSRFSETLVPLASTGCLQSLIKLNGIISDSDHPPSADVVSVFTNHLEYRDPPESLHPTDNMIHYQINLGLQSLSGLYWCWKFKRTEPHLRTLICDAWPSIWKWTNSIARLCILQTDAYGVGTRNLTFQCITDLLVVLACEEEQLRIRMASTSGFMELLTNLWLDEAEVHNPRGPDAFLTSAAVLSLFLLPQTNNRPGWVECVINASGDDKRIATACLNHIRHALGTTPPHFENLVLHSTVLSQLMESRKTGAALLHQDCISLVMKTLASATSNPYSPSTASSIRDVIFYLCIALKRAFLSTEGVEWVCQALNKQLLPTLLRVEPWLPGLPASSQGAVVEMLTKSLAVYMMHRPVVIAVERSFQIVDRLHLGQLLTPSGELLKAWKIFRELAKERLLVRDQLDQRHNESSRTCSSTKCRKQDGKRVFKRCKLCLQAHYCSKECQIEDWKNGDHRTRCEAAQELRRKGLLDPISRREMDYISTVTTSDLRMNAFRIRHLMATLYSGDPLSSLVAHLDYTTYPVTITVGPAASLEGTSEDTLSCSVFDREETHRWYGHGAESFLLARIRILQGQYTIVASIGCEWPREDSVEMQLSEMFEMLLAPPTSESQVE